MTFECVFMAAAVVQQRCLPSSWRFFGGLMFDLKGIVKRDVVESCLMVVVGIEVFAFV